MPEREQELDRPPVGYEPVVTELSLEDWALRVPFVLFVVGALFIGLPILLDGVGVSLAALVSAVVAAAALGPRMPSRLHGPASVLALVVALATLALA